MYLEREQWKKFLREVDKQVKWRYENFGTPPVTQEKEDEKPTGDQDTYRKNIGKKGKTNRKCSLWKNPKESINDRLQILEKDIELKILDFDNIGMYKVELSSTDLIG